ncbi:MAG: protein BatD [Paludibacteraceae bacterium]|nr:protein BatD [Paludibacteraceae bacterium]
MRYWKRTIITAAIWCGLIVSAGAATFKAVVNGGTTVVAGKPFKISYTLNEKDGRNFSAPSFGEIEVVAGPFRSVSTNLQIINGQASSSYQETYTYTLIPHKTGTFHIGPASIQMNGSRITSNALTINVVAGNSSTSSPSSGGTSSGGVRHRSSAGKTVAEQLSNLNIFVRAIPTKRRLYEQDCLVLTYKLYSLSEVIRVTDVKVPHFNGFVKQEIAQPNTIQLGMEEYNGKTYSTAVMYQAILYPQQSGELEIEPMKFDLVVRVNTGLESNSFFGSIYSFENREKTVVSPSLTIHVDKLPSNRPKGYSGGVGTFQFSSSISSQEVNENDAITLTYRLTGNGNLKLIKNPKVEFPADFEVYDPKIENNFKNGQDGVSGSKTVEYLLIPRSAGDFTIPGYEFSYFDVGTRSYKTIRSPEYKIHVNKGNGKGGGKVSNYAEQERLKVLGNDIRYIHTGEIVNDGERAFLFGSTGYWLWILVPIIGAVILLLYIRKSRKENSDERVRKSKGAHKQAVKRLKTARRHLEQNEKEAFYQEIMRAMWGYLSDKLNMPVSELSKENVRDRLTERNVEEVEIEAFMRVIETCEMAQYSPSAVEEMGSVYESAVETISKMQEGTLR